MSEKGEVIEINGDIAQIRIPRTDACSKCRKCSAGATNEFMTATVRNQCGAKIGDWVYVEVEQKTFAIATLVMYGIPLVSFFVGIAAGWFITGDNAEQSTKELVSFLTGIIFVLLSYAVIRFNEKRFRAKEYTPIAIEIAENYGQNEEK